MGSATYGQGVGVIHIDDVQCDGDEIDLFACSYTTKHNCIHAEDAGVQCAGQGSEHFSNGYEIIFSHSHFVHFSINILIYKNR